MSTGQEIAISIVAGVGGLGVLVVISVAVLIAMAWGDPADLDNSNNQLGGRPSGKLLMWRALWRRCPICGWGRIFRSYFAMNWACPICGSVFWRNDGEYLGPMVIDYTVAVTVAMVSWAPLAVLGASDMLQVIIPTLMTVGITLAAMPWSRSFWTIFLYINGEMVPRTARARSRRERRGPLFLPSRRFSSAAKKSIGLVRPKGPSRR
jgi:uncharacterized protein (DUF983 family)